VQYREDVWCSLILSPARPGLTSRYRAHHLVSGERRETVMNGSSGYLISSSIILPLVLPCAGLDSLGNESISFPLGRYLFDPVISPIEMEGSTMKALRFHGANDLRLDEVTIPAVEDGYVKVGLAALLPVAY
jgi:hypothetical protein